MKLMPVDLQNAWNVNCGDLPKCHDIHYSIRELAASRLLEKYNHDLPRIVKDIKRVAKSRFCNGYVPTKDYPGGFRASFDWFVRPGSMLQVEEGVYDGPKEFTEPDPGKTAPADLRYWERPRPEVRLSDDEMMRAQINGRLQSMASRDAIKAGRPVVQDFCLEWVAKGGPHPWATEWEIEKARNEVMELRARDEIPGSWGQFQKFSDRELAEFSLDHPRTALPKRPACSFKEFLSLKERIKEEREHGQAQAIPVQPPPRV